MHKQLDEKTGQEGELGAAAPPLAPLAPNLCVHPVDPRCITTMVVFGSFPLW